MGAIRFTYLEKNLVVGATSLLNADDREMQQNQKEHYSKTHRLSGIYGVKDVYVDNEKADEDVQFFVDAYDSSRLMAAISEL